MSRDSSPRPSLETASPSDPAPVTLGMLGMTIFLASLSMLFVASLMGYLVVRLRAEQWPPPDAPGLPGTLWLATVVLLLTSAVVQGAKSSSVRGRVAPIKGYLVATAMLGLAFLLIQFDNWRTMAEAYRGRRVDLYAFTFYMLTVLHAVHVVGGLAALGVTTTRAFLGRDVAAGVRYCTVYWHFLMVVWLIVFVVMMIAS